MKTLYLLRHAEASWKDTGLQDFDRPLNSRGREAAPLVGRLIRERRLRVDLIISSPAVRARQTAALVRESAGLSAELLYDERIYEADAARLLEVVARAAESADALMLVGHNPGMEKLLAFLTGEGRHMATATLACVALDAEEWIKARAGRLEWLVRPKESEED
ncbi:MAG TPA: histidine phosphatase family protein [Pyrinomonadaceae bacterium]|nr:histidine phosphatase family protein [Pyrinomonadaceae bacterium]